MSGRRIELSATQIVASVLAAMTGAVAASYLGVTGTLIGAAVLSFASTAGTAVYRHYLGRGQERLRNAAASRASASRVRLLRAQQRGPAATDPGRTTTPQPCRPPDAIDTQVLPVQRHDRAPGDVPAPPGPPGPGWAGSPDGRGAGGGRGHRGRRRWLRPALLSVAVFLVTMAAITVIEVATGSPLDSLIWHRHGSGTTVGNVITGHTGRSHPATPAPTISPSATPPSPAPPSSAPAPSPTGPATPSPSPSPAPSETTTAPAPGSSPSQPAGTSPAPPGAPAPSGSPSPTATASSTATPSP